MKKKLLIAVGVLAGGFITAYAVAKKHSESEDVDINISCINKQRSTSDMNIQTIHSAEAMELSIPTAYERSIKPVLDKALSFGGLVVLSPMLGVISLAIYLDDPGPIMFVQRRVGKDGKFFYLHKFRTMKMNAPSDVPTHLLTNPESYITRVGKVLRRTSLDELPQVYDIFRGCMSVIGPRPALWNQEDLVEHRGFANKVLPGLTGLAQINGRDELEIEVKAEYDKEYVRMLRKSSTTGFLIDCKCFFGTIISVLKHDGVVEGGTGSIKAVSQVSGASAISFVSSSFADGLDQSFSSTDKAQSKDLREETDKRHPANQSHGSVGVGKLRPGVPAEDPETDWGYKKTFSINREKKVSVLITGAGSYIGTSFEEYCHSNYPNIEIFTIDLKDSNWASSALWDEKWDSVFHVAGIAHADVGKASAEEIEHYYAINTDLAIETARLAKEAGVKQFIFMSSMIVYGDQSAKGVNSSTRPNPTNFYGDSKWQSDKALRAMAEEMIGSDGGMKVAVLRPPMIYGKGSNGNYPILAAIAKKMPIFPAVNNRRSMLYIENLCEFLSLIVLSGEGGVYVPQNKEYSNTSSVVAMIASVAGRKIWITPLMSSGVFLARHIPGKVRNLAEKAFGSSFYDQNLSRYEGLDYQKVSLEESIRRIEG